MYNFYSIFTSKEYLIISVISSILAIVVAIVVAKSKGRSAGWGWLAFLLGWIGVIIVACLSKEETPTATKTIPTSSNYSLLHYTGAKAGSPWECKFCGNTNTEAATTCLKCNKSKYEKAPEKWTCSCGQENNPKANMCINCGKEKE